MVWRGSVLFSCPPVIQLGSTGVHRHGSWGGARGSPFPDLAHHSFCKTEGLCGKGQPRPCRGRQVDTHHLAGAHWKGLAGICIFCPQLVEGRGFCLVHHHSYSKFGRHRASSPKCQASYQAGTGCLIHSPLVRFWKTMVKHMESSRFGIEYQIKSLCDFEQIIRPL